MQKVKTIHAKSKKRGCPSSVIALRTLPIFFCWSAFIRIETHFRKASSRIFFPLDISHRGNFLHKHCKGLCSSSCIAVLRILFVVYLLVILLAFFHSGRSSNQLTCFPSFFVGKDGYMWHSSGQLVRKESLPGNFWEWCYSLIIKRVLLYENVALGAIVVIL